mgnify:CR=1 FL=1
MGSNVFNCFLVAGLEMAYIDSPILKVASFENIITTTAALAATLFIILGFLIPEKNRAAQKTLLLLGIASGIVGYLCMQIVA